MVTGNENLEILRENLEILRENFWYNSASVGDISLIPAPNRGFQGQQIYQYKWNLSQINPVVTKLTKIWKFKQKISYNSAYARDMSSLCRWNIQNLHPTGDINEFYFVSQTCLKGRSHCVRRRTTSNAQGRTTSCVVVVIVRCRTTLMQINAYK